MGRATDDLHKVYCYRERESIARGCVFCANLSVHRKEKLVRHSIAEKKVEKCKRGIEKPIRVLKYNLMKMKKKKTKITKAIPNHELRQYVCCTHATYEYGVVGVYGIVEIICS